MLGYQRQNQRLQLAEGYAKRWKKAENTKILYRKLHENMKTTKWGMNLYTQEG